jgi:hypothetical protein
MAHKVQGMTPSKKMAHPNSKTNSEVFQFFFIVQLRFKIVKGLLLLLLD